MKPQTASTETLLYDLENQFVESPNQTPEIRITPGEYTLHLDAVVHPDDGDLGSSVACLSSASLTTEEVDVIMHLSEAPPSPVTPMLDAIRKRLAQG
jgi:hypothetical protein